MKKTRNILLLTIISVLAISALGQAQSPTHELAIEVEETYIEENATIEISTYALNGEGQIVEDQSAPPVAAILWTPENESLVHCWNHENKFWSSMLQNDLGNANDCHIPLEQEGSRPTYINQTTLTDLQGDNTNHDGKIRHMEVVVFDYEVNSPFLTGNTLASGTQTVVNADETEVVTESFLATIGPEISGLSGSQLLELFIWSCILGFALWNNWIFVSVITLLPLFGPVFRNAGANYPVNFIAGVFLVSLAVLLRKWAGRWGEDFKSWLLS